MGSRPAHSTGRRAGSRPVPRIVRGSLVHQVGDVQFAAFRRAACAWSALEADRAEALEIGLQRAQLVRPALGLDPAPDTAPPCPDCGSTDWGHATPCGRRLVDAVRLAGLLTIAQDRLGIAEYADVADEFLAGIKKAAVRS